MAEAISTPRRDPWQHEEAAGRAALALIAGAWTALLALVLRHQLFITNDSVSNYAHVWYVSKRLWLDHTLPFYMPILAHGSALAFPYSFLPWLVAALLRPVLGDWVVTLGLVGGALCLIWATFWALPELRRGWSAAIALANPVLLEGLLLGQMPYLWACALFFVSVGLWRRGRHFGAIVACAAAQATHPAALLPIAALFVSASLLLGVAGRTELKAYVASLLLSLPATYFVLSSPVVGDSSIFTLAINLFGTVMIRLPVIALPFATAWLLGKRPDYAPGLLLAVLVLNLLAIPLRDDGFAWGALLRKPDTSLEVFLDSDDFVPGAVYRVLRSGDGKLGMYQMIQKGGILDSEFFPESIQRRSWPSQDDYRRFLTTRDVDFVLVFLSFDRRFHTNEHALLREIVDHPDTAAGCIKLAQRGLDYELFSVDRNTVSPCDVPSCQKRPCQEQSHGPTIQDRRPTDPSANGGVPNGQLDIDETSPRHR